MKTFRRILKIVLIFFGTLILLSAITVGYAFFEPYWIQYKHTTINDTNLPQNFDGVKLVYVSDLHCGPAYPPSRIKSLVNKINKLNPDVILLGGDYVRQNLKYISLCFDELSGLKAKLGKFAVLGNHDNMYGREETITAIGKAGIKLLDNDSQWVNIGNDRIKIGGVGDLWTESQQIDATINDVNEKDFVVLLSHNPAYAYQLDTKKVDLVISGHTHGGELTLFGLWSPVVPTKIWKKYRNGIVKTDNTKILVSNGIGTGPRPIRFFARPQINIVTLKKAQ